MSTQNAVCMVLASCLGVAALGGELGKELPVREVSRKTDTVEHDESGNVSRVVRVTETAVYHSVKVTETWVVEPETGHEVLETRTTVECDSEKNTVTKVESRDPSTGDVVVTSITKISRSKDGETEKVVRTPDEFGHLAVSSRSTTTPLSTTGDSLRTEEVAADGGGLKVKRETTTVTDGRLPAIR